MLNFYLLTFIIFYQTDIELRHNQEGIAAGRVLAVKNASLKIKTDAKMDN